MNKLKILIAYDGSSCADAALDDLRWAGLPNRIIDAAGCPYRKLHLEDEIIFLAAYRL